MRSVEEIIRELPENIRGPIYEALIAFRDDVLLKETRETKFEIGKVWEAINDLTKRVNELTERVNDLTKRVNELTERVNDLTKRVNELTERVNELTGAQKRTNQEIEKVWNAIKELTEAQKRTEQEIEKIWGAIRELTEAQKRTEQRLNELAEAQKKTEQTLNELKEEQKKTEQKFRELVEAQRKTEQTLNELKEEQKKTEQKFQELAEAQRKTEESLKKLIEDHRRTREKLEGLSDSFGYLLEDRAMKSLPKILKREHKIEVVEKLKRDYFVVNGEYVEVNIFGRVRKGRKEYILLGEAKSRVSKKAIDNFVRKCDKISKRFSKEVIKVFISYIFSPEIKEYSEEKGIILVPSYELEL